MCPLPSPGPPHIDDCGEVPYLPQAVGALLEGDTEDFPVVLRRKTCLRSKLFRVLALEVLHSLPRENVERERIEDAS